jgi:hypothetical protein
VLLTFPGILRVVKDEHLLGTRKFEKSVSNEGEDEAGEEAGLGKARQE